MISFIKRNKIAAIFIGIGILGGYLYWYFIGCNSGTCPLTSVWYGNAAYGAMIGYLVGDSIQGYTRKQKEKKENEQVQ